MASTAGERIKHSARNKGAMKREEKAKRINAKNRTIKKALSALNSGNFNSRRQCARAFELPEATLRRASKALNFVFKGRGRRPKNTNEDQGKESKYNIVAESKAYKNVLDTVNPASPPYILPVEGCNISGKKNICNSVKAAATGPIPDQTWAHPKSPTVASNHFLMLESHEDTPHLVLPVSAACSTRGNSIPAFNSCHTLTGPCSPETYTPLLAATAMSETGNIEDIANILDAKQKSLSYSNKLSQLQTYENLINTDGDKIAEFEILYKAAKFDVTNTEFQAWLLHKKELEGYFC